MRTIPITTRVLTTKKIDTIFFIEYCKQMLWFFEKIDVDKIYSLPAGTYYIGDICYVLDDIIYDHTFGGHGYESGMYQSDLGQFLVSNTYAGDGCYRGSDGFDYAVDAGIIGIVSESLVHTKTTFGRMCTFPKAVTVRMYDGIFEFQSEGFQLEINTRDN